MTNDLTAAVAEIKRVSPASSPWEAGDIGVGQSPVDYQIAVILNAVASCALVPAADVQGLHDVYWKLRSYAVHDDGCKINKPPYTIGSCSCGLTASLAKGESILTKWENRK